MSLNPDQIKQAQGIIFSRKKNATTHPPFSFNNVEIKLISVRKHLGLALDSKLSFNQHITDISFIRQTKVLISSENCKQFHHVPTY